jgi:hypothetical protein
MMKRLAFLGLVVLVLLVAAVPVGAGDNASEACNLWAAEDPDEFDAWFDSHGDCVRYFNANDWPAAGCKSVFPFTEGLPYWEWRGFENIGQCVSYFRHLDLD